MAAAPATPRMWLYEETSCSLCRNFLTDPVMLECGHNFCKGCILKYWEDPEVLTSCCPQCQTVVQRQLVPNPQLGNVVNTIRRLNEQLMETVTWGLCEKHQKPLKFFCKLDGAPICVLCKGYRKHADHPVVPAEAAAEEYKAQIDSCLEILMKEKEEVLTSKSNVEKQGHDLIGKIEILRQSTVVAFIGLREFLEEEENRLLAPMEEMSKRIAKKRDEDIARLSQEPPALEKIIQEMEEARNKPPRELLKNIKGMLQRYEQKGRFVTPAPFPPAEAWSIWNLWEIYHILETATNTFNDTLTSVSPQHKENVTLDPETAHPQLLMSEDRKCVTVSDQQQTRPEGVRTSAHHRTVLGSVGFKSGIHCWEVEVGEEEGWAVGIAVANVQYNRDIPLGPDTGVWAIGKWEGQYWALIPPSNPPLPLKEEPKKVRVSLNYTGGRVVFFDAETADLLFSFPIPGHLATPYYPFFWLPMNCKLRLG